MLNTEYLTLKNSSAQFPLHSISLLIFVVFNISKLPTHCKWVCQMLLGVMRGSYLIISLLKTN